MRQLGTSREATQGELSTVGPALPDDSSEIVVYRPLIRDAQARPEWDLDLGSSVVSAQQRQTYFQELDSLELLLRHYEELSQAWEVTVASNYLNAGSLLEATVLLGHHGTMLDHWRAQYEHETQLTRFVDAISRADGTTWVQNSQLVEALVQFAKEFLNVDPNTTLARIQAAQDLLNSSAAVATLANQINGYRRALINDHRLLVEQHVHEHASDCPLCGQSYDTLESLIANVGAQTDYFNQFLDQRAHEANAALDGIRNQFIDPILQRAEQTPKIKGFYLQLKRHETERSKVAEFLAWCTRANVDVANAINREAKELGMGDVRTKTQLIQTNLRAYIETIQTPIAPDDVSKTQFLFQTYFHGDLERLRNIGVNAIQQKRAYINSIYFRASAARFTELQNTRDRLDKEIEEWSERHRRLKKIHDILDEHIRRRWYRIIEDIEIVFYTFFSKITHYHQRGTGMFIVQGGEMPSREESSSSLAEQSQAQSIKFVHNLGSDQDALQYLSSGQLSALVMAFTLALNRVYVTQGPAVLLIDDPVQTMDDINMASFVDLLANDFWDKQIIISTHEDDVSRYLNYKFKRYKRTTDTVSMFGLIGPSDGNGKGDDVNGPRFD